MTPTPEGSNMTDNVKKAFLFTCIGGTNHGQKTPYKGHEIHLPEKRKYEDRFERNLDSEIVAAPLYNEVYTYRQFGIDRDTNYGFYCLKEMSNREAMARAGIVEVPK